MKLTILMPCLNESETLERCIRKANDWLKRTNTDGEVLIADNGSTDGSQRIATDNGARVVDVEPKGYGSALFHGALAAKGEYIIMGDSDDSYDFSRLDAFVEKLDEGYDLVMGNRFKGGIAPGAMPWKNKYIGNPVLTWIGRMLFRCPAGDFHCGLRGFRKDAFRRMDLRTTGMEYASEMVIKANLFGMKIAEVPTTLSKDGRSRPPHLRPWRDGWRHLKFMFLFRPRWLFVIPGLVLFLASAVAYGMLMSGPQKVGSVVFDVNTLFYAQTGIIVGLLSAALGGVIRIFGMREGLMQDSPAIRKLMNSPVLEVGCIVGLVFIAVGVVLGVDLLFEWNRLGFGEITNRAIIRMVSVSSLSIILGCICFLFSLIMGFLGLPMRKSEE